jgi:hypothetical protein
LPHCERPRLYFELLNLTSLFRIRIQLSFSCGSRI